MFMHITKHKNRIYKSVTMPSNLRTSQHLVVVVIQSSSHVWFFVTPWAAAHQASLSLTFSRSLPKFMFIASVMPSSHLSLWALFSSSPPSFPASKTFPMSCLFTSDDQNTGAAVSASVPPVNIQGWFPVRLTGLILQESSPAPRSKASVLWCLPSLWSSSRSHREHWVTTALTIRILVGKVMSLLFSTLLRFVITFLLRSDHLLISWLLVTVHSDSRAQEEEICHYFHFSPFYLQYIPTYVTIPSNLRTSQHLVVVVIQLSSHVWFFVTPWTAAHQAFLFIPSPILLPTEITIILNFVSIIPFKNSFCI